MAVKIAEALHVLRLMGLFLHWVLGITGGYIEMAGLYLVLINTG